MNEKLDELAFHFFKLFAQYEFYLKDKGYFEETKNGRFVVNWDRFVNERIGKTFMENLGDKSGSAEYILTEPPMQQIVQNGNIIWDEVNNKERSIQILFGHISRIRNNLFHGAKFHGTWFDEQRSEKLLKHGLIILQHYKGLVSVD